MHCNSHLLVLLAQSAAGAQVLHAFERLAVRVEVSGASANEDAACNSEELHALSGTAQGLREQHSTKHKSQQMDQKL